MHRNFVAALVGLAFLAMAAAANASITSYDITVSGGWFDTSGNPYGMPYSPTLNGSITVDSTQVGAAALLDFSLTTGSQTWVETDLVGPFSTVLSFDGSGILTGFSLDKFELDSSHFMNIYSNNTLRVQDGSFVSNACNHCVSFTQVPEPATLAIFGVGLAGLGFLRRRRKQAAA